MTVSTDAYSVEYPCDWVCRIEFDLGGISDRYNHRQMREAVDDCHLIVHAGGAVRDEFTVTNLRAKAGAR